MLIAQITDLHLRTAGQKAYHVVDTARYLPPAIATLNALEPRPDVVLITGDLTDSGQPREYAALRDQLEALELPWYVIPGNHDARSALRDAFPEHAYLGQTGFMHYTLEDHPVRLIGLDTLVPGDGRGELCRERLDWLAQRLAEQPGRPTLLFMHHPPFAIGMDHMDARCLTGARALEALVHDYPNIERLICGHVHRTIFRRFGGTIANCCPSIAHQTELNLTRCATAAFVMEPPGYQLHLWQDGALVTHTGVIGDYDGPYPCHAGVLIDE